MICTVLSLNAFESKMKTFIFFQVQTSLVYLLKLFYLCQELTQYNWYDIGTIFYFF